MGGCVEAVEAQGDVDVTTAEGEAEGLVGLLVYTEFGEATGEGGVGGESEEEDIEVGLIRTVGCVVVVAANMVEEVDAGGDGRGVEEEEKA